jgi:hypothetical protein
MASYRLGQTNEARALWQQARALMPRLATEAINSHSNQRLYLMIEAYLEEAAGMLGLTKELPPATPMPTNAIAPR